MEFTRCFVVKRNYCAVLCNKVACKLADIAHAALLHFSFICLVVSSLVPSRSVSSLVTRDFANEKEIFTIVSFYYSCNNSFRVKSRIFPTLKSGTIEPLVTPSFLPSPDCVLISS